MTKKRYALALVGLIGLAFLLHLRYGLFAKKILPSICTPTAPPDLSSGLFSLLLNGLLPEGASGSFGTERDAQGREFGTVLYRDRAYKATLRRSGSGACFDFTPPLPLRPDRPSIREDIARLPDAVAQFLFDRWAATLVLAAIVIWVAWLAKRNRQMAFQEADCSSGPLVAESLPELSQELERLLLSEGETALAAQVPDLRIVDRCRCGDDFCSTFYVQPKPEGAYGPDHRCVPLEPKEGDLVLDVVGEKIAAVQVLYRDEVRQAVERIIP
jgi:hypothetical protein